MVGKGKRHVTLLLYLFMDICAALDVQESADFSVGAVAGIAGIAVAITVLVALPVGVVIGLGVAWSVWRRGHGPTSEGPQRKMEQQLQEADYETVIHLRDNQAYGRVGVRHLGRFVNASSINLSFTWCV